MRKKLINLASSQKNSTLQLLPISCISKGTALSAVNAALNTVSEKNFRIAFPGFFDPASLVRSSLDS
jgi:hypothetical protein